MATMADGEWTQKRETVECGEYSLVGIANYDQVYTRPVVVMAHGITGDKDSSKFLSLERTLQERGIASFRFDFYGRGQSPGRRDEIAASDIKHALEVWKYNLKEAVDFVADEHSSRIGILGSSFGARVAALYAAEDGDIGALVLRAPPFYDEDAAKLGKVTSPTLVVAGTEDTVVPQDRASYFTNQLGGKKSMLVIIGADHGCDNPEHEKSFVKYSAEWFVRHLLT